MGKVKVYVLRNGDVSLFEGVFDDGQDLTVFEKLVYMRKKG